MIKLKVLFTVFIVCISGFVQAQSTPIPAAKLSTKWKNLLDNSFSNFDKFTGVPHTTLKELSDEYPKGDGKKGTPIGLNKDPLNVFTMIKENNEDVLFVNGKIYAGLSTKEEYGDYHLSVQFKWGEKVYEPRLTLPKDSGILYHCLEPQGAFWNVWMNSIEFQVCEREFGDLFALSKRRLKVPAIRDVDSLWIYKTKAELLNFGGGAAKELKRNRCKSSVRAEKPNGEWNTLDLYCLGDMSIHVVNNVVVNVIYEDTKAEKENNENFLRKGKIQFQSEGAEAYYKNMKIKALTKIPKEILNQL